MIGLGNFGSTVATELVRFGNYVIGIDLDEALVSAHAETLNQALILDARDDEALRHAGIDACGAGVIGMGSSLEASVLATMNLRLLGIERIWAKATSRTHHRILSKLGADRVIHPEVDVGRQIAQVLHNPLVRDYVALGNGFHVVNLRIPATLDGKPLNGLPLRKFNLRCLGVMRGTEFIASDGPNAVLHGDDRLLLLGRRADLRSYTATL
ncbi:K+ uptake system component [Oceaniovalibus guishaninsula JLT2003]|uniref:K+ uptake system component n=1 Tax=Oceaniovalibus guishaninsula JLT2003 TaxID=1231392 RepID=K2HPY7_9RHOB|nr:K+ uptake system component [Oceaniovalibus guishaninsula JLT2003]